MEIVNVGVGKVYIIPFTIGVLCIVYTIFKHTEQMKFRIVVPA